MPGDISVFVCRNLHYNADGRYLSGRPNLRITLFEARLANALAPIGVSLPLTTNESGYVR